MDNAAKALLMAAEILIAVLIITLAVYAFTYYKDVAVTYDKSQAELEIQKFNNQYTKYLGENLSPQEILTLVHIAKDYNKSIDEQEDEEYDDVKKDVEIMVQGYGGLTSKSETELIDGFVKHNNVSINEVDPLDPTITKTTIKKFKCDKVLYNDENRVYEVIFKDS